MEVKHLLKEYLDYLEIEKNRSLKTRENYGRYLTAFFKEAKVRNLVDITAAAVRSFRLGLARREGRKGTPMKKSTQGYYAIAIRNFLKYLAKRDFEVLASEKIELPKLPTRDIDVPSYGDLERMLSAPTRLVPTSVKREGAGIRALRDRAILEMLFSTGLRVAELCGLNRYLELARGEISVRGKGEKLRVVFISPSAREAAQRYLSARNDGEEALFVSLSRDGKPLGRITPRAVERLVDRYARVAGVGKRVTPHSFRHLFATDLLVNGADLRSVQELLGHQNIGTTQVYTHLTNRELREVHKAFHGRRRS